MALELKCIVETSSQITVNFHCKSCSFHFNSYLKQLYISNKTERFGNKNGCDVICIEAFERRADLGYRQTASMNKDIDSGHICSNLRTSGIF